MKKFVFLATTALLAAMPLRAQKAGNEAFYTETALGIDMPMVYVEAGTFTMGCTEEQGSDCDNNEKNVRKVTLDAYYIGTLEVTQAQWEKVMGTNLEQQRVKAKGSYGLDADWPERGVGNNYPMYYVNWDEAQAFCEKLSKATGRTYALPTEAQWEYACRGGNKADGTKYSGGNEINDVAWFGTEAKTTHVCGGKKPNALGLYDMSGNVFEWCKDVYGAYNKKDTKDPQGTGSGYNRVRRGGSWGSEAKLCRVTSRSGYPSAGRSSTLGFRVVMLP